MANQYIIRSELLSQNITVTERAGGQYEIDTEDGVHYSPKEVFLTCFMPNRLQFSKHVHTVKKLFGGEIVNVKKIEEEKLFFYNNRGEKIWLN